LTHTEHGDPVQVSQAYKSPGGLIAATIEIPLTRGYVTRIDAADRVFTDGRKWHARESPHGNTVYAATNIDRRTVLLHRLIAPGWAEVDHADGDGLNNCRYNLRDGAEFRNEANKGVQRNNTTGFKGVVRNHGRWSAYITINKERVYLGNFGTPEEAADAYDQAAVHHFGEYAKTNAMMGRGTGPRLPRPPARSRVCPPGCTCQKHAPRAPREFCPAGHEYTPENTYIRPNGCRDCRKCKRDGKRRARPSRPSARSRTCPVGCTCGRHNRRIGPP
jgi:hypothetical protein